MECIAKCPWVAARAGVGNMSLVFCQNVIDVSNM